MNFLGLHEIAILALATAAISVTTAKSRLFASARRWLGNRSSMLGELASCHYCTSHWVGIALVALYRPVLVLSWHPFDLFVSAFAVVAIAALISGAIIKLTPFRGEVAHGSHSGTDESNIGARNNSSSIR